MESVSMLWFMVDGYSLHTKSHVLENTLDINWKIRSNTNEGNVCTGSKRLRG